MKIFPRNPTTGDKSYISVKAVNRGTAPTTITHCCGFYSVNLWDLIRGKKQNFIVTPGPPLGQTVPFKLGPGEEWSGLADQHDFEADFRDGFLYIGVIHNQRKRPIYARAKFKH